jgi:ankyrin repeat protein
MNEIDQKLLQAASEGDLEGIEQALAQGADLEVRDAMDMTPLTLAVRDGQIHAVLYLLDQGAPVTHDTILVANMSVYAGPTLVKLLQLAQIRQVKPKTAGLPQADADLLQAAYEGNVEALTAAIKAGAKLGAADQQDTAALRWAARWGHQEAVEAILEAGADINQQSYTGWTALMEAVVAGHEEIAGLLIERGIDVNALTFADASALYFAYEIVQFSTNKEKAQRIIRLLEEHGAEYSEPEEDRD